MNASSEPKVPAMWGACPICESCDGELAWDGTAQGISRRWVRCGECRTARDVLPLAAPLRQRIGKAPMEAGTLHEAILRSDELIGRLRAVGYGESWLSRPGATPLFLEIGSGWGTTLAAAEWRGFESIGVEPDLERAAWARGRLGVMIFDTLDAVPVMPTDVVLIERFSQYDDPAALLKGVVSRLVPEGVVVLSMPLLDHPLHRARGVTDPVWLDDGQALLYERSSLSLLLLRSGLFPEQAWHHPSRPGEAVIIARRG